MDRISPIKYIISLMTYLLTLIIIYIFRLLFFSPHFSSVTVIPSCYPPWLHPSCPLSLALSPCLSLIPSLSSSSQATALTTKHRRLPTLLYRTSWNLFKLALSSFFSSLSFWTYRILGHVPSLHFKSTFS